MKVLIIDDSTINNILLQSILEDEGYQTSFVLDGKEAFNIIGEFKPDVILLDIMMPGMSGFDVLKKMNNIGYNIPVIALSAYKNEKYERQAISLGAHTYLTKPVKSKKLFRAIEDTKISQY
jgi:CheY-like chemotaxis protein